MRCRLIDLDESVSWFHVQTFRQLLLVNAAEIRYDNTMKSTLALALACSILAAGGCCLVRSIWTSRLREVQDAYVNDLRALKHELQEMQTQHVLLQAEHNNLGLELWSLLQLQAQHEALQETHKELVADHESLKSIHERAKEILLTQRNILSRFGDIFGPGV